MSIPERKFLALVDTIHRAGLDPGAWQDVVDGLHEVLPMACVSLHGYQSGTPPASITVAGGWDPGLMHEFKTQWAPLNPYAPLVPKLAVGVPVVGHESSFIMERVRDTEFYQDWLLERGYGANVGIPLWTTADRVCFLVFDYSVRRAVKVDKRAAGLASAIAPHVARSFEVSHRFASLHHGPAQLATLLERIGGPALIVDSRQRVRAANRAGEALLRSGGTFKVARGGVALAEASAEAGLARALHACFNPDLAAAPSAVGFTTKEGAARWLNVVPLVADDSVGKGPLSRFLAEPERLALLIVTTPWSASSDAAARLRDAFKLTPAEVKLAVALMQGSSTGSYARSRGIAPNTARNQLRSLLEKTETHRQAELVAVLFSALGHSN